MFRRISTFLFVAFLFASSLASATPVISRSSTTDALSSAASEGDIDALKFLTERGKKGDVDAQEVLGEFYFHGRKNIPKDISESTKWYDMIRTEATSGDKLAQERLGLLYYNGVGGRVDWDNDRGIKVDWVQALTWLKKAAGKGSWQAQMYVGKIYWDGRWGVERDRTEAATWYYAASKAMQEAADNGDGEAAFRLAAFYVEGDSPMRIERNLDKAFQLYSKAAELGNSGAQLQLARMYKEGQGWGINQNYSEAYFWYGVSTKTLDEMGYTPATDPRDQVADHLTDEQRKEVDKRIAEWKPTSAISVTAHTRGKMCTCNTNNTCTCTK